MIIDDLPSISIANDSDEIAIEQGTATKKITKGNFLQEVTSAITSLISSLSGKVSKSGDTMTGDLAVTGASITVKDSRITSGTTPSSNIYGRAFYLMDSNGYNIGTFQVMSLANGREGFQLVAGKKVGGVNKNNYMRLNLDANGDPIVDLSSPAAWRTALSLNAINNIGAVGTGGLRIDFLNGAEQYYMPFYASTSENNKIALFDKNWNVVWKIPKDYKANDTYTSGTAVISGIVTNNAKRLLFMATVDKSLENISTVTVTDLHGHTAGVAGVIDGNSSAADDLKNKSGYTVSATKINNNTVRIQIDKSTALTNATTATPFAYYGYFTLKFT